MSQPVHRLTFFKMSVLSCIVCLGLWNSEGAQGNPQEEIIGPNQNEVGPTEHILPPEYPGALSERNDGGDSENAGTEQVVTRGVPNCNWRPHFDTTVGQGTPYLMVTIGDSVIWGQGHRLEDSFASQIQRWLSQQHGRAVRKIVYAHSGATIDPVGEKYVSGLHGEINWSTPTILEQVDCVPQEVANKTDLILMDGCINDFGAMNIMMPITDQGFRTRVKTLCETRMSVLLQKVVDKFPNALVAVIGYFPLMSPKSDPKQVGELLKTFGLVGANVYAPAWKSLRDTLSVTSTEWYNGSNESLEKAVKKQHSGRAVFVKLPAASENAFGAPNSYLYGLPDLAKRDPVFGGRFSACRTFYGNPSNFTLTNNPLLNLAMTKCMMASSFHPNAKGVTAYREAIIQALRPAFEPCPNGAQRVGFSCIFNQPWADIASVVQETEEACREQTIRIERYVENGRKKLTQGKVYIGREYFAELNEAKRFTFHTKAVPYKNTNDLNTKWKLAPTVSFQIKAPGYQDSHGTPKVQAPRFFVAHSVKQEPGGRVKLRVYAARDSSFTQPVTAQVIGRSGKVLGATNQELDVPADEIGTVQKMYQFIDGTVLTEDEYKIRQKRHPRKLNPLLQQPVGAPMQPEHIFDQLISNQTPHVWVIGDCFEPTPVAESPVASQELLAKFAQTFPAAPSGTSFDSAVLTVASGPRSLQSVNFPTHFIRHRGFLADLTPIQSGLDKQDASFVLVPGLADSKGISFESMNYPGHYLRHQGFRVKLQPRSEDALYKADATFYAVQGLTDKNKVSFRSLNFPDRYMRHRGFQLFIEPDAGGSFSQDATFLLVPALVNASASTNTTQPTKPTRNPTAAERARK